MVLSWIQWYVFEIVLKSIILFDKTYDASKDLYDRFDEDDMICITDIQEYTCRLNKRYSWNF